MGADHKIKLGKTGLLIDLLMIFLILFIFGNVSANPLIVYVRYNVGISGSIINIISLFIVNLPINLSCILIFQFLLIKKFKLAVNIEKIPIAK